MGLVPELVAGLESVKIKQVSCGHFHTAALSEDGELFRGDGVDRSFKVRVRWVMVIRRRDMNRK